MRMKDHYRFPRTYDEAFKTADYGCAVERPYRRERVAAWLIAALVVTLWLLAAL